MKETEANHVIQRAFVLGAGLGTRLKSLTANRPKPLIPVCGKPLISHAFEHLAGVGIDQLVVNTHHCAEKYSELFPSASYDGLPIRFAHEEQLLETAGGIKNVEPLLRGDGPAGAFIVYNGDIFTDLPLERAVAHHFRSGNEVTLVLRSKEQPHHIALDEHGRVLDISNRLGISSGRLFLFTGIYIVEPAFFARIPADTKISVIPIFMQMIRESARLGGVVVDEGDWWDLGTREQYLELHRHLKAAEQAENGNRPHPRCWIDSSAKVAPSARLLGATSVGANVEIGANAALSDCIIWENAKIAPESVLKNCVVTAGAQVRGVHTDEDL